MLLEEKSCLHFFAVGLFGDKFNDDSHLVFHSICFYRFVGKNSPYIGLVKTVHILCW